MSSDCSGVGGFRVMKLAIRPIWQVDRVVKTYSVKMAAINKLAVLILWSRYFLALD